MPDKIGKYRIIEQIGRGGMGTIYKAHDPVLDRLVALKVISTGEVTDELRARFFREAQACAKLNHPNIVTVFDMGEDEGQLFFVMELLEGQELRRLITAPDAALTLEDKLALMIQTASGLHYAHQKGIVHRDIKPGNIFVLASGRAKILDFGVAHMAATEGLTRTGLIMGTLRYISPEQVRGRFDHRSDMFSLGSVIYELLTSRPPFEGDDPMHLLEQLRSEDPPPLNEVDASLPAALTGIVQRAMKKNPGDRFRDLDELRVELERVQRDLLEERQGALTRVRGQRERIAQLQTALAERLRAPAPAAEIPGIEERHGLAGIQELERDLAARVAALEAEIAQTDAMASVLERADSFMKAGRYADAVAEYEAIVAQGPAYRWAREGLDRARAELEAQRQRRQAAEIEERARAALKDRRYAQCLEILQEAAALSLPAEIAQGLQALRDRALREQEELRRRRQEAEAAAAHTTEARAAALAEETPQYAPAKWNEAQALAGAAEASLRRGASVEAREGFDRAIAAFQGALETARQAQAEERRAADRAREAAIVDQQGARAAGAEQYAADLWNAAQAKFAEAQAALGKKAAGRAAATFAEALSLYRRAKDAAQAARERERRRAEAGRERAEEGRRSAAALGAEARAPSLWQEAAARSAAGEAAWLRQQYPRATEAFEAALGLYHQAQAQVREAARRQREESARQQQSMAAARRDAAAAEAAANAPAEWAEAEAGAGTAEAALERNAWEEASADFGRAVELYRLAEARAREVSQARDEAERASAASGAERTGAVAVEASRYAPEPWKGAQDAEARAVAAFSQQRYASASALFTNAQELYADARHVAEIVREAETNRRARTEALSGPIGPITDLDRTMLARPDVTAGRAGDALDATVVQPTAPPPSPDVAPARVWPMRWIYGTAAGIVGIAAVVTAGLYWRAPSVPPRAVVTPAVPETARAPETFPGRDAAERLRSQAIAAREEAIKAGAERLALTAFTAATDKVRAGEAALGQRDVATAQQRYQEAIEAYGLARTEAARSTALADTMAKVQTVESQAAEARRAAELAEAPKRAVALWAKAGSAERSAEDAFKRQAFDRAQALFSDARKAYRDAERAAVQSAARDGGPQVDAPKRDLEEAEKARKAAIAARQETEAVSRQAPQLFAAAQRLEADGETALNGRNFATARQRFIEAQQAFKQAAQEGERIAADVKRKQTGAEQARGQMNTARAEAAQAGGERRAGALWKSAQTKERDGQAALARSEFESAARLFGAAEGDYRGALQEARKVGDIEQRRSDAAQARVHAADAKRGATDAHADLYAGKQLASAQAKERDAQTAFDRSDYAAADQLFRAALGDYQGAAREAEMRVGMLKSNAEQSKSRTLASREQAVKAEADRVVKDVFDAAQAKQTEGDGLMGRQNFASASQSYQDAADRYVEAGMRAQVVRDSRGQADAAKARMLAEKQRAKEDAPDYRTALAEESQGATLYDRQAFKEAAERFVAAERLFTKAAATSSPRPPTPAGPARPARPTPAPF